MAISAIDAISPAFQHTRQQLVHPFLLSQWAKLALVGFLAGELTSGGCGPSNLRGITQPHGSQHFLSAAAPANPMLYAGLIAVLLVAIFALAILFLYVSSVMRFVLFDSVVNRQCQIAQSWHRRQSAGSRYFIWQIVFLLAYFATLVVFVGMPVALAAAAGWLRHGSQHVAGLVLGGLALFFVFLATVVFSLIVQVLTKDFVVPQMALEDLGPFEAWRKLLPQIMAEKGAYAGYLGLKIVMAIGAAIVLGIITLIVILLMLIPAGGIGIVAVLIGKAAGLTWNLYTISCAVVIGCIALAVILYVISFISVPATVFFPAYAIYFFASRYPMLDRLLHPVPAQTPIPPPLPESSL